MKSAVNLIEYYEKVGLNNQNIYKLHTDLIEMLDVYDGHSFRVMVDKLYDLDISDFWGVENKLDKNETEKIVDVLIDIVTRY
jgi:hypothetical protein